MATAPGSTLTALQAGSGAWKWVIAMEGYPWLFSDAAQSEVGAGWTGTDWGQALSGVTVVLENEQRLDPWNPFPEGGTFQFYVPAQSPSSDPFGVDTGRSTAGNETILDPGTNQGIDNDDTTATVRSTANFPASGTVYIGTETIAYTGKTATTLTGLTRGKFASFAVSGGTRFGHQHRVRLDENAVQLAPLVTDQPRSWLGRWVGAWLHRYDHGTGLMNTKANAQLCYAGRVVSVRDDEATLQTVVECEHVLKYISEAVLCQNQWSATVVEGITLVAGWTFTIKDTGNDGTTWHAANDLLVKTGASGANEIEPGLYTVEQLHSLINDWLASELAATRIVGTYTIGIAPFAPDQNKPHTYFSYRIPGAGPTVAFHFTLRKEVNEFLGDIAAIVYSPTQKVVLSHSNSQPNVDYDVVSHDVPMRNSAMILGQISVTEERGVFEDQSASLPVNAHWTVDSDNNAIFLIDNKYVIAGRKVGSTISQILLLSTSITFQDLFETAIFAQTRMDDGSAPVSIKQIFMFEDTFANVFAKLLYSTGTAGYNHATYDAFPAACGLSIPHTLLGTAFTDSLAALPGADMPLTLVVEKPKKLMDAIGGDMLFRWAFLRWKSGGLQVATWKTPLPGVGSTLSDANKAASPENNDGHRASTLLTDEWQASIIKINYNRDITDLTADGGYRDSITIEDRTAVEDAGGQPRTRTINLANTYSQNVQQGAGVEGLKDGFMALAPMMATRPVRRVTRTIDSRFFEGYSIGDSVLFADKFARDPDTGLRGVTTRPGLIVMHRWTIGGPDPKGEGVSDVNGEVELLLLPLLRVGPYVPAAQLDDTSANAGLDAATKKIATCYAHKYSETSEAVDASYMSVGRKIRLIEKDPVDPTTPSTWDDTVAAQSGNTVTLTTGFAAFDNTKKYDIVWDTYGDAIANQQTFAYQADDADGMIFDARAPYQYVSGTSYPSFTANTAGDAVELPANITFGDAVGLDVATQTAINRLINNLIDFKTAHCEPWVTNAEIAPTKLSGSAVYELVECRPINLTSDNLLSTPKRSLTVAPLLRSSDGTSASVRITLVKQPPGDNTTSDVNRGGVLAEAVFTTTSTTLAIGTPATLNIGTLKDLNGNAFLLVELTLKARFRGLAQCQEGPRA
jgi:hypothetical protein